MNSLDVIRLVAYREIRVKARSKSFLVATGAMLAAVIVGGILVKVIGSPEPDKVGVTPQTASLAGVVKALSGSDKVTVRTVADDAAGRDAVKDGDLDALLTGTPDHLEVVVKDDLDPARRSMFTAVAQQQALSGQVTELGGDPDEVRQALADAVPTVVQLDPRTQDSGQVVAAYLAGILIFLSLITAGQLVAQGVVEEKTSRVVELLLATIKPWQLMAGKVIGIGAVGLAQVVVVVAGAVGTASGLGLLDSSSLDVGATALATLGWFLIGFATFALVLAGLAALVSRQEDVGSVIAPVTMLMTIPYIVAVSIGTWEPDNPLVAWLSRLPFSAPMVMPVRIAGGDVAAWEVVMAVGLSLALVPVLTWVAGRLYANGVLHTGGRVRFLQALRSAPERV